MSKTINNVPGDIYIGKESGKMILDDIRKAKKSVRVMSPYLSAGLVEMLLNRFTSGVHIELVTSGYVEDYAHERKNCYRIIRQHKHVDETLRNRKNILHWTGIVWMTTFGLLTITNLENVFSPSAEISDFIEFGILAGLMLLGQLIRKYALGIRFWQYSYSSLFPVKIFRSHFSGNKNNTSKSFNLHSKLYIIDDCIAYLGSVNFTRSGCLFNHETRVRITDLQAIRQLRQEFSELLWSEEYDHTSVDEWGKELYGGAE
ncbi:phospholipase D family protein [uncultured Fluviicola sp.]|uniref:phospholipase D family protein n=1 Tax=uncultured Fluviicola sp. TaxID=463303 RepID=UPI0025F91672|nr:phospholipase D family protein [uncultured Fluviicola sp.]